MRQVVTDITCSTRHGRHNMTSSRFQAAQNLTEPHTHTLQRNHLHASQRGSKGRKLTLAPTDFTSDFCLFFILVKCYKKPDLEEGVRRRSFPTARLSKTFGDIQHARALTKICVRYCLQIRIIRGGRCGTGACNRVCLQCTTDVVFYENIRSVTISRRK